MTEEGAGRVAALAMCVRSAHGLCAWANAAFGALFPEQATPLRLPVEVSGGAAFAQCSAVSGQADLVGALADLENGRCWSAFSGARSSGVSDPELFRHR